MRYTINKLLILESVVARPQMSTVDKVQTGTVGALGAGLIAAKAAKLGVAAKAIPIVAKAAAAGVPITLKGDDRVQSAIHSGAASTLGTLAVGGLGAALGSGVPGGAVAVAAGMAGAKGATLGAIAGGGRDTFVKSSLLPAGVVYVSAPITNAALEHFGYDDVQVDAGLSAGLTGAIGAGAWAYRNWDNKRKQYI